MPAAIGMKLEQFQRHITGKHLWSLFVTGVVPITYYYMYYVCMVKAEARRGAGASASSGLDVLQLSLANSHSRVMHLHRIHFALPVSSAVSHYNQPAGVFIPVAGGLYVVLAFLSTGLPSHADARFDVLASMLRVCNKCGE